MAKKQMTSSEWLQTAQILGDIDGSVVDLLELTSGKVNWDCNGRLHRLWNRVKLIRSQFAKEASRQAGDNNEALQVLKSKAE